MASAPLSLCTLSHVMPHTSHSHILLSFVVPIYRQMVASLLLSSSCTWEWVAAIFFNKGCCHLLSGGGHLLGVEVVPLMAIPNTNLYPNLVTKETLLTPSELASFRNFSSQVINHSLGMFNLKIVGKFLHEQCFGTPFSLTL